MKKEEVKEVKEEVKETSSKEIAIVEWRGRSREFSKEIHGKDFEKLAKQFADKFDGEVK